MLDAVHSRTTLSAPEGKSSHEQPGAVPPRPRGVTRIRSAVHPPWSNRNLDLMLLARVAMSVSRSLAGVLTPIYLALEGFSAFELSAYVLTVALVSALLSALIGVSSDRIGRRQFLIILPLATAAAGVTFALTSSTVALFVMGAVGSFGRGSGAGAGAVGPYQPAESALVTDSLPSRHRTAAFGLLSFASCVGGLVGSLLALMVPTVHVHGDAAMVAFRGGFLAIAVAAAIAGILAVGLVEMRVPQARPARTDARPARLRLPVRSRWLLYRLWVTNSLNGAAVGAVVQRIAAASGDWAPEDVTVVFVGRGCSVTDANADHIRLGRVLLDAGGYATVLPAFIQVARPTVTQSLEVARFTGSRKIVVMPHYLFPGRLATWVRQEADAWAVDHPDVEVRVADVIGACPELAQVVAARYREGMLRARTDLGSPAYLTGLLLTGRRVVAVGGGCVNRRRVPKLVAAGAKVTVVAPTLHKTLTSLVEDGRVEWVPREYRDGDLDGAWYVLAATDSPEVNARIAADAEARHTFCVRADRADAGSAWTPTTGEAGGATVAVLASHDPHRSRALRDRIVRLLEAPDEQL